MPNNKISIKALSKGNASISRIEVLGSKEKISWKQYADKLVIEKPASVSNDIAIVFKIQMK
jgi:alpha-L-fucosidase